MNHSTHWRLIELPQEPIPILARSAFHRSMNPVSTVLRLTLAFSTTVASGADEIVMDTVGAILKSFTHIHRLPVLCIWCAARARPNRFSHGVIVIGIAHWSVVTPVQSLKSPSKQIALLARGLLSQAHIPSGVNHVFYSLIPGFLRHLIVPMLHR